LDIIRMIGDWLMSADPIYIYLFITGYAVLEVVFPPFPGDVLVVFGGYLAGRRGLPVFWMIVAGIVGCMAALFGAYMLGRFGRDLLVRSRFFRKYFPQSSLQKAEGWIVRYGKWVLLISRFLPAIRSPLVVVAGMAKTELISSMILLLISVSANVTIMVLGGKMLGENWSLVVDWLSYFGWALLAILVVLLLIWIIFAVRRRKAGAGSDE
jgi:membrane protein DedA with SNARE-associated domain